MKKLFLLLFLTLFIMKGYAQQNFASAEVRGAAPKIGQKNFSIYKRTVDVNPNDSVGVNEFVAIVKCQGYALAGFKVLVDGSPSEINSHTDSVMFLSRELKWYSNKTHTIELICNIDLVGTPACPSGKIEVHLFNLIIGPMTLGSESIRFDDDFTTEITVGELVSNSYFTPSKVEALQKNKFLKAGDVKFSAQNTSLSNDKLVLNVDKSDVKKVVNFMFVIGGDTTYEHSAATLYLTRPDSIRLGETLDVQIFFQLDSNMVKLIDTVHSLIELRSFDHCVPRNSVVILPNLLIEQKISKNGIDHKYQFSGISIYPNPAHDILNVPNLPVDSKIFIIDMTGKSIEMVAYGDQIDISSFVSGMYVIRIGEVTSRFYKQ